MKSDMPIIEQLKTEIDFSILKKNNIERSKERCVYKIDDRDRVTDLKLESIGLQFFPETILKLQHLSTLRIASNQISQIPPNIKKLKYLQSIYIGGNLLTILPPEIGSLPNLKRLSLSGNQLNFLPKEFANLSKMENLTLRNNRFTSFPKEVLQLTNLKKLDLKRNEIHEIPKEIINLICLKYLSLEENPIEFPPIEIIKQGIEATRDYLKELIVDNTVHLFEAKILVVGQGRVGKTYLLNRLVHNAIDPETISTEGIDIYTWEIKTKQTDEFKINFWDFGGQEVYHSTHQFFLTKRSLYLFVWEARSDSDLLSFDYWLNTIRVLSDNSPIIVVQNKVDERKKCINQEGWKIKFSNIIEFHDVSALESIGINTLKNVIVREIEKLPHIGDLLPKRWVDIRKRLEGLKENYIPYSRYQEICAEFGMNAKQMSSLSEYYHDLGVFLHFNKNPILQNTIFLKPEWATNAVYKVIDSRAVIDNHGKFKFSDLENIWTENPKEKYIELLELMKNFELCFELPNVREYIIPELLRGNQPDFDWDDTNNLRFNYSYDFMPAGVITRFIVISHDLIKNNFYWKDGVVLTWENTDAKIVKTDNRAIEVSISGDDKKGLLAIVRRHMYHLNSAFSNLKIDEMIPCICDECRGNPESFFYPYKDIKKALKKNKSEIECRKSFDSVSIDKLLGEIEDITEENRMAAPKNTEREKRISSNPKEQPVLNKVFISYSHKNKTTLKELQEYLKPIETLGLIDHWDDNRIRTGDKWKIEIEKALNTSKFAVLMISQSFLASDFITKHELPPILKAAEKEGTVILPIFVDPCKTAYSLSKLVEFQGVNSPDSPLSGMTDHDKGTTFDKLMGDIIEWIKDLSVV